MRGPARELGWFYETMLRRGRGILSPQAVEAMTARHRVNTLDKTFGAIIDWGLGFMIATVLIVVVMVLPAVKARRRDITDPTHVT